jgi:type I restriction enzyme, R subunit
MSNFSFVPRTWSRLIGNIQEAETQVYSKPMYAATLCRKGLEEWVRWLYAHDEDLEMPQDTTLSALLHDATFKRLVAPLHLDHLNLIRKIGNTAVHTNQQISVVEVLHTLKLLHGFVAWVVRLYSEETVLTPAFDESLVPKTDGTDKTKAELLALEKAFEANKVKLVQAEAQLAHFTALKNLNIAHIPPPTDPNEALTRTMYIDTLLREAGWDPKGENVAEYAVHGMPQGNGDMEGNGFVDYVLWGDDGKPLAVVEAKRTRRDPRVGQQQALLYADCLQKQFGQRPVIFYSNGFHTWLWDDTHYIPREVFGFYTKDALQMLVQRRSTRHDLSLQTINNAITDRPYQHEAIRSVTTALATKHREALLIMATGTGKTRVSAALVDLLSKANWAKRILFLADRTALIHQAKLNFNDYLPNLPAVDLTREKEDESSRIVFSTYQTIINMIDEMRDSKDRMYSVGHFDLIIFDEIHRSVYNRYKHIFKYFDGFRIGLTATPRADTDKDTYGLFGMEPNNPTYAYELEQAVSEGYLVPPKAISVPIKFQRQGIKYADLSAEEKLDYEAEFSDPLTGEYPEEIDATALNQWLFNTDTVDKALGYVMQNGIKVEGGDKLAKTMIFARSHLHALFIAERFDKQYPKYRGEFLRVIDYHEEYRGDLLNKFKVKEKMPQIAVSVDMLDTGIDVPEVCNLVFFKPVRSSVKYWQMVGRGTRLCKDLFGIGEDKKEFVIFDFCENFEYFDANPAGMTASASKSLSHRLFELRLRVSLLLQAQEETDAQALGHELLHLLIAQAQALNGESFIVRQHWEVVEKYRDANAWNALSDLEVKEIFDHIAPLVNETDQDEQAKRFDALLLDLQLSVLLGTKKQGSLIQKIVETAALLTKKANIPSVAQKMHTLRSVQEKMFWAGATVPSIEKVRIELRDLIKFLDTESRAVYQTNFEDEILGEVTEFPLVYNVNNLEAYRRKITEYLRSQKHHITIHKLNTNQPITKGELNALEAMLFEQGSIGTKAEFVKTYGEQPLGKFVRSILGLDTAAARKAFSAILQNQTLNAAQIRFIDTIINFLTVKGEIDPNMLFEAPFTDMNHDGISGVFNDTAAREIITIIKSINANAEAA